MPTQWLGNHARKRLGIARNLEPVVGDAIDVDINQLVDVTTRLQLQQRSSHTGQERMIAF